MMRDRYAVDTHIQYIHSRFTLWIIRITKVQNDKHMLNMTLWDNETLPVASNCPEPVQNRGGKLLCADIFSHVIS